MKTQKVFLIELVCSQGVDGTDNEPIEERLDCGYFLSLQKFEEACKQLSMGLNDGWKIEKSIFEMELSKRQKWLYTLFYEYSIGEDVYYYSFPPCTSRAKCIELKRELLKNKKYQHDINRHYFNNNYGWSIEQNEIIK